MGKEKPLRRGMPLLTGSTKIGREGSGEGKWKRGRRGTARSDGNAILGEVHVKGRDKAGEREEGGRGWVI